MDERFVGTIVGVGTAAGTRIVVGRWERSPLGAFTDVMVELPAPDGQRVLLAPTARVAAFVGETYTFDAVRVVPVVVTVDGPCWSLDAGPLRLDLVRGKRSALGWLLSAVPRRVAVLPAWIGVLDAVARRLLPGVRTRGSARGGREEFYGALDMHRVVAATVLWDGVDQGALAPVAPPVRFGFGSTPRQPSAVRVVTTIRSGRRGGSA